MIIPEAFQIFRTSVDDCYFSELSICFNVILEVSCVFFSWFFPAVPVDLPAPIHRGMFFCIWNLTLRQVIDDTLSQEHVQNGDSGFSPWFMNQDPVVYHQCSHYSMAIGNIPSWFRIAMEDRNFARAIFTHFQHAFRSNGRDPKR